jgi:hypothetical protein
MQREVIRMTAITMGTIAQMAAGNGASLSGVARRHAELRSRIGSTTVAAGGQETEPMTIKASPYVWTSPEAIPPRQWLYGKHLIRTFVGATIAPGGLGKTSLGVAETLAMTSALDLLGMTLPHVGPLRVWYMNLEDPREEITRQVQAAALRYRLTREHIGDRLFVDSGRDQPVVIAEMMPKGAVIVRPVVDAIVTELQQNRIDVLKVDPFVSSHAIPENDNGSMDLVVKEWGRVADAADCAVELIHHTRKQNGDAEVTAESGRGAKALIDGCRSVRVLNRMTKCEAAKAGVTESHRRYFRVYADKANLTPPADKSDWFRLASIDLGNGRDRPGDLVGVVEPWTWPDAFDSITAADASRVRAAIAACDPPARADVQASHWAGRIVAATLGLDLGDARHKAKIKAIIKTWIDKDVLAKSVWKDSDSKERNVIVAGENDPAEAE